MTATEGAIRLLEEAIYELREGFTDYALISIQGAKRMIDIGDNKGAQHVVTRR